MNLSMIGSRMFTLVCLNRFLQSRRQLPLPFPSNRGLRGSRLEHLPEILKRLLLRLRGVESEKLL